MGLLPYSTLFITEAVPAIYFRPQKPERISVILCYAEHVRKPLVCRVGRRPGQEGEWLAQMDSWPAHTDRQLVCTDRQTAGLHGQQGALPLLGTLFLNAG